MLRAFVFALILVVPALAENKPAAPPGPTVTELQVQVAQLKAENARLQAQLNEVQFEESLYEAAGGVTQRRARDQQAIEDAVKAWQAAQAKDAEAKTKAK